MVLEYLHGDVILKRDAVGTTTATIKTCLQMQLKTDVELEPFGWKDFRAIIDEVKLVHPNG